LPSIGILELKNIQFFWFYSRSSITNWDKIVISYSFNGLSLAKNYPSM
jgi:hypothetical protein